MRQEPSTTSRTNRADALAFAAAFVSIAVAVVGVVVTEEATPGPPFPPPRVRTVHAFPTVTVTAFPRGTDAGDAREMAFSPGPGAVRPSTWNSAIPDETGRYLLIYFLGGNENCSLPDHADITYGDDVQVTLFERSTVGKRGCFPVGIRSVVVVPLDEPIDGRDLVDCAAGTKPCGFTPRTTYRP